MDFQAAGEDAPTPFYLGRFSFSSDEAAVVSDWRSPVAGLFYECDEPGPAGYDAPAGRVEGLLARKRQLGVERGRLGYAADSASTVRDEVLARELGRSSDKKMRTIVASIQAEQNRIIRDEEPGTLVIQGVAGSGKTSIALHRVAYLLYRRRGALSSRAVGHPVAEPRVRRLRSRRSARTGRGAHRGPSTCAPSSSGRSAARRRSRPPARAWTRRTACGASAPV